MPEAHAILKLIVKHEDALHMRDALALRPKERDKKRKKVA
jgi:hypothetical protein